MDVVFACQFPCEWLICQHRAPKTVMLKTLPFDGV